MLFTRKKTNPAGDAYNFVGWVGYAELTWQPAADLPQDLINEFERDELDVRWPVDYRVENPTGVPTGTRGRGCTSLSDRLDPYREAAAAVQVVLRRDPAAQHRDGVVRELVRVVQRSLAQLRGVDAVVVSVHDDGVRVLLHQQRAKHLAGGSEVRVQHDEPQLVVVRTRPRGEADPAEVGLVHLGPFVQQPLWDLDGLVPVRPGHNDVHGVEAVALLAHQRVHRGLHLVDASGRRGEAEDDARPRLRRAHGRGRDGGGRVERAEEDGDPRHARGQEAREPAFSRSEFIAMGRNRCLQHDLLGKRLV
ncbi:hypothetical protein ON010_g865 [Phytophthora cinnamomi]|nr:hypothetical protein ON010_g865 [Phytophthora cinnamomi]